MKNIIREDCKEAEKNLALIEEVINGIYDKIDSLADALNSIDANSLMEEIKREKLTKKHGAPKKKERKKKLKEKE